MLELTLALASKGQVGVRLNGGTVSHEFPLSAIIKERFLSLDFSDSIYLVFNRF